MVAYTKPYICWPTVLIFILSIISSAIAVFLGTISLERLVDNKLQLFIANVLVYIIVVVIASFASYSQFTVTHESVHANVSRNKYVNDIIGIISSFWLGPFSNWFGFKMHHLVHHRETNDLEHDPDMWCSKYGYGGEKYILVRWMTLDFYYLYAFITDLIGNKMKRYDIYKVLLNHFVSIYILYWALSTFGFFAIMQYWVLPSRFAITFLSFAFDYLPHYPHDFKKRENRYKTTSYIACPWFIKLFLSPISFYQDYHLIHHDNPSIPFYKYKVFWDENKESLLGKGVRINEIVPPIISSFLGENI
jgi:beta-carotene hydroxylase